MVGFHRLGVRLAHVREQIVHELLGHVQGSFRSRSLDLGQIDELTAIAHVDVQFADVDIFQPQRQDLPRPQPGLEDEPHQGAVASALACRSQLLHLVLADRCWPFAACHRLRKDVGRDQLRGGMVQKALVGTVPVRARQLVIGVLADLLGAKQVVVEAGHRGQVQVDRRVGACL